MCKRFLFIIVLLSVFSWKINGFFDLKLPEKMVSNQDDFHHRMLEAQEASLDIQKQYLEINRSNHGSLKSHINYINELDGGLLPRFILGVLSNAIAECFLENSSQVGIGAQALGNFLFFDLLLILKMGTLKQAHSSVITHHIIKSLLTGYAAWDIGSRLGRRAKKILRNSDAKHEK